MHKWSPVDFVGGRVRIQRLADARFFSGWTRDFRGLRLSVSSQEPTSVAPGDAVSLHLYGRSSDLLFMGEALEVTSTGEEEMPVEILFRTNGEIRSVPSSESPRFLARNAVASIGFDREVYKWRLADYCVHGLGVLSDRELPRDSVVRVACTLDGRQFDCTCQVRYSRRISPEMCRIGLQIIRFAHGSEHAWNELMERMQLMRAA